jgi:hypothetical protein
MARQMRGTVATVTADLQLGLDQRAEEIRAPDPQIQMEVERHSRRGIVAKVEN